MSKSHRYTPAPEVPAEMKDRYQKMLEVLAGRLTVAEAARQLGMSRNHVQHLMHRGLQAFLEGVAPKLAARSRRRIDEQLATAARAQVRAMNGLIGANTLSHRVPGLSRRGAAEVLASALTEMENERRAAATRVRVTTPGAMRGFDAMHLKS